jgi:predicted dehydrogenase
MKPIRVGIVGCGNIGSFHTKALQEVDGVSLAAVADTNIVQAKKLGDQYGCPAFPGFREMLDWGGVDLVSICLPPALHLEAALAAAEKGKHVLMEKPMDVSAAQADKMIACCRSQRVKLGVISQHRFDPVIQVMQALLAEQGEQSRLGKPLMGTAKILWYRGPDYYQSSGGWRGLKSNQGGVLMAQAIHTIDLLQYLMGGVEAVQAVCRTLLHKSIEVEDTGLALLRFKGGAIGSIEATTAAYPGLMAELMICTENATISIRDDKLNFYHAKNGPIPELEALLGGTDDNAAASADPLNLDTRAHAAQYRDMACAINENREPLVNGEAGRVPLALIETIYQASESETWRPVK